MTSNAQTRDWTKTLPASVMIFGCGYVGTAVARNLIDAGVRVGALTQNPAKAELLRHRGLTEVLEGALEREDWHPRVQEPYEAVVNCVSSAGGGIEGYRKSYVGGQRSILKWAQGKGLKRFVYTSSTSVYPQDGGVTVDETADTSGAPQTAQVLLEAEGLLAQSADLFESWYVLRLAGIYGPGRHYLLDLLRKGETVIPGRGDYTLNLVHLEDVVSAICIALATPGGERSGVYNISDNAPETKAEVLCWLARKLGRPEPRFDPEQISSRLERRGGRMPDRRILNDKARAILGWKPVYGSFQEGYQKILAGG